MPTVHRESGYTFRFFSGDRDEPPHIHVSGHGGEAKVWLPHRGALTSRGYNRHELRQLVSIVEARTVELLEKWDEFFR